MKIVTDPYEMQGLSLSLDSTKGFVPTMGALHAGHGELIRRSVAENEHTTVSIFVNPTQFNDPNDLKNYPRTWDEDLALAQAWGTDLIFAPEYSTLYPDNYSYVITEKDLSKRFCGADRPGHFDGVLSVVMKLLQIVRPEKAYFGEKDFQQLRLIEGLVRAFFIPCEIVPVPTLREESGLALSSRNTRLTEQEKVRATKFNQILRQSSSATAAKAALTSEGFQVDYVEDWGLRRLGAVKLGAVRLIDNVQL